MQSVGSGYARGIGRWIAGLKCFVRISSGYGVAVPEPMRDVVRRSVAERVPIDDTETEMIVDLLARYDALAEPFSETADPTHVTGSAIVVGPRGVMLLKHRRLGLWLQPGGHVEPGEAPWEGARREAEEETGLDLDFAEIGDDGIPPLVHVDVHAGGRGHTHLDLRYVLHGDDRDPEPPAGESQEIAWFGWPAAIERASDHRLTALLTYLSRDDVRD